MIKRAILKTAQKLARQYPIVTILGPRQSGKTTLAKQCFPFKPYVNLENIATRNFAEEDPLAFLEMYPDGAIFDEIQRVPSLLSYIQIIVDERDEEGLYILTGSHQFDLRTGINQSLAGRTAILKLLPFSMQELEEYGNFSANEMLFNGAYPRIYEKGLEPPQAYSDYIETYIERDLRQIITVKDLSKFRTFLTLLAGRVGQLLNITSLANDTGVAQSTVKDWLSVLEASFICFTLQPWQPTIRKRLVKAPKLYFYDTGIVCTLLGIENVTQIVTHPLRGNLYENLVIVDIYKSRLNASKRNNLLFYRDSNGNEVDLLYMMADKILPIEIKSGKTISSDYFKGLNNFCKTFGEQVPYGGIVVYNGEEQQQRKEDCALNEKDVIEAIKAITQKKS